jgi:hypothetical protein
LPLLFLRGSMKRSLIKRTPFEKGTPSERKKLHDKAWRIQRKIVILRDKMCITCGSTHLLQAGHFLHNCLDFDLRNINAQCKRCNYFLNGKLGEYRGYLENKYGKDIVAELKIAKKLEKKLYPWEYELIIADLKEMLKEMNG